MTTAAEFVSDILDLGVPVFAPTWSGTEFRRGMGWQNYTADGNADRLASYTAGQDALCAVCGDAFAVVDADPRNGCDISAIRALLSSLGVRIFAEVDTPGQGKHFYVAGHPDLRPAHFRPDHPGWPGLDIQSHGTNVYLPGTSRRDKGYGGRGYTVVFSDLAALADGGDVDGAEALADWVAAQTPVRDNRADDAAFDGHRLTDSERNYLDAAVTGECQEVTSTPSGGRNGRLNVAAYKLGQLVAGAGLDQEKVYKHLAAAGAAAGLEQHEAAATIRSGLRGGFKHPRRVPDRGVTVLSSELSHWAGLTDDDGSGASDPDPDQFWEARPELEAIRQWAHARICSPWAVLGAVLLRAACVIPPWVALPPVIGGRGSLNFIVALVGPPGSGKDAALDVAETCYPGGLDPIHTSQLATGEGIAHQYKHRSRPSKDDPIGELVEDRHTALFVCSEIDTAKGNSQRTGSTLLAKLRDAYTGNDIGGAYSTTEKRLPMPKHTYRFALAVCVQPLHAQWILDDVGGGLPQRLLWMPTIYPQLPEEIPGDPDKLPDPEKGAFSGTRIDVIIPQEIIDLLRQTQQMRIRGVGHALDGHALFTREKVAYILAVLNGRKAVMTMQDWELAGQIMAVSNRTRAAVQAQLRSHGEKAEEYAAKRAGVRQAIQEDTAAKQKLSGLCQRIAVKFDDKGGRMTKREFDKLANSRTRGGYRDALDHLLDLGRVRSEEDDILAWVSDPG